MLDLQNIELENWFISARWSIWTDALGVHWLIGRIERKPLSNWSGSTSHPLMSGFILMVDLSWSFSWLFNCHFIQILDQPQTLGWWRNSLVKSWHTVFLFVWLFHAKQLLGMNFANLRFFLQLIWSRFGLSLSSILISGPPIWFPQIDWLPRRLATNSRLADQQRFRFSSFYPLFSFSSHCMGRILSWIYNEQF